MTRIIVHFECAICRQHVQEEIAREQLASFDSAGKTCGRADCKPRSISVAQAKRSRPRRDPRALETPLVHACLELIAIKYRNIEAWRQNQGALEIPARFDEKAQRMRKRRYVPFAGEDGISDICGFIAPSGRFLAIECKIRPNKPTDDQKKFLSRVDSFGGLALVVYDDVMDLERQLRGAGL